MINNIIILIITIILAVTLNVEDTNTSIINEDNTDKTEIRISKDESKIIRLNCDYVKSKRDFEEDYIYIIKSKPTILIKKPIGKNKDAEEDTSKKSFTNNIKTSDLKTNNEKTEVTSKTDEENNSTFIEPKEAQIGDKTYSVKELKKQITFKDKLSGFRLATKVNVRYLISVMKEGGNSNTKQKVKVHLKEKLSEEDYNKVRNLVHKYIHLIE